MSDSGAQTLTKSLAEVRTSLVNEAVFNETAAQILRELESYGLRLSVTVSEGQTVFATYGDPAGWKSNHQETRTVAPFQIVFSGGPAVGSNIQDVERADEVWETNFDSLVQLFSEHWRGRKASSGLWTAEDASVSTKRLQTVEAAVLSGHVVSYVRLDCDGFDAAKQKLGGEQAADKVIAAVAGFFRRELSNHCLVFHPHGDEFELVFVRTEPRDALVHLMQFQDKFSEHDFRPAGCAERINLGIRMAVSFWLRDQKTDNPKAAYGQLRAQAEGVELKKRPDRGFIEIAQQALGGDGRLTERALGEGVLCARRGLALERVQVFADDLQDQLADWLVSAPTVPLTDMLAKLAQRFVIRTFSDSTHTAFSYGSENSVSRYIPTAKLAAIMLHVILKRRFMGLGPALPKGEVRLAVMQDDPGKPWRMSVQQVWAEGWVDLLSFGPIQPSEPFVMEAGHPWVPMLADPDGSQGLVARWVPPRPLAQSLAPCLAVLAGSQAESLEPKVAPWAASVLRIDDRPVTSGNLPDFWQSNLARIVVECLANPNIRTILVVRNDPETVKRTMELLTGACQSASQAGGATPATLRWDTDEIGRIADATSIRDPQLSHFRHRGLQLVEIAADTNLVLQTALAIYSADQVHLAAKGEPEYISWPSDLPSDPSGPRREFNAVKLSDAYPRIIRALRHAETPRYSERNGTQVNELTGVRVQFEAPSADDLPAYWAAQRKEFELYYARAFKQGSLFGTRFYRWGATAPGERGTDQVARAVKEAAEAISGNHLSRRIMIITAQPPGEAPCDPLGLTSVHIFPRRRPAAGPWFVDFLWVWRSVEAIVGFPFSAHGAVRFSDEFTILVKRAMGPPSATVRLGTVTYIAISLHLYCDSADLAIARHIDLEAQA